METVVFLEVEEFLYREIEVGSDWNSWLGFIYRWEGRRGFVSKYLGFHLLNCGVGQPWCGLAFQLHVGGGCSELAWVSL